MARTSASKSAKPAAPAPKSKKETVLALLKRKNGASIVELAKATGWQDHSVRGFLSGTVRKKLALTVVVTQKDSGARRYSLKRA